MTNPLNAGLEPTADDAQAAAALLAAAAGKKDADAGKGNAADTGKPAASGEGSKGAGDAGDDGDDDANDPEGAWDPKRAMRKISKLNREAEGLRNKEKESSQKTTELERSNWRLEVALDLGLPKVIAVRLQGNTREDMVKDAEEFLQLLVAENQPKMPRTRPDTQLQGGGKANEAPEETDVDKLGAAMFRR